MKNIGKIIFTFCTILIVTACVDNDKLFEIDDFETGALPNITATANDDGFVNFLDLPNTTLEFTIDFSNTLEQSADGGITNGGSGRLTTNTEFSEVSSIDLEMVYTNFVTGTTEKVSMGNYTSWPATVTLSVDDLVAAVPSLTSQSDINVGDIFNFVNGINFVDGRVFPAFVTDALGVPQPNFSVNFSGTLNNPGFQYNISYNVACPSNLAGNYVAEIVSSNINATPGVNFTSPLPVTITGSNGAYQISDGTMDIFGVGGPPFPIIAAFTEICGVITVAPQSISFPGAVDFVQGPGTSFDFSTGVITFDLTYAATSCCGLPGIQYTFTVTPI